MKNCRSRTLTGISMLVLLASCSVRMDEHAPDYVPFTLSADQESRGTRTVLSEDSGKVLWSAGDQIALFNGYGGVCLTSTVADPAESSIFEGRVPADYLAAGGPYWGLYPYRKDASFTEGTISTTLPSDQEAVAGTFSNNTFITAGYSPDKDNGMVFKNLCSGIRFKLDRSDITSVTLIANGGEPLSGRITFEVGGEGNPVIKGVSAPESSIRLQAPDGGALAANTWYYIVAIPSELENGFTLFLEGESVQGTFRYSSKVAFNRGKFVSANLSGRVGYARLDTYDVVGSSVRSYLVQASSAYPDDCGLSGYNTSVLSRSSASSSTTVNPVSISWDGDAAASIVISTDPLYNSVVKTVSAASSPASVYNLIPGKLYFYKVVSGDETVKEACVRPYGPLRIIDSNLRDLGGWTGEGGKTVKYGVLFRGDNRDGGLSDLDKELGISVDLDLRGYDTGSPKNALEFYEEDASAYYKQAAAAVDDAPANSYLNLKVRQFMVGSRYGVTAELYQVAIRYVIRKLESGGVVYFHCIGGADRTGTLAFLIEALLGVAESDLSQDFELTTLCYSSRLRTNTGSYPFKTMVTGYLYPYFSADTIQEVVTMWAETRHSDLVDPLSESEIQKLKDLLLE